ncbi:MAG: uroporphyrinogen-III synthase [Acidimicrobiales bacterium]
MTGVGAASGPLKDWRVIVTRARAQSSELVRALADLGAIPVELPVIEIADPADGGLALAQALARLEEHDWVVFTSANAVERCWERLAIAGVHGDVKVAAIGAGTAAALAAHELTADLVPDEFVAESLVAAFPAPAAPGAGSVLLPCAAGARGTLAAGLRDKGWQVEVVEAYRTVRPMLEESSVEALAVADAVTFTSSSAVTGYLELAGHAQVPPVVACIGPITARTAIAAGLRVDVVAREHCVDGLVEALVEWVKARDASAGQR